MVLFLIFYLNYRNLYFFYSWPPLQRSLQLEPLGYDRKNENRHVLRILERLNNPKASTSKKAKNEISDDEENGENDIVDLDGDDEEWWGWGKVRRSWSKPLRR